MHPKGTFQTGSASRQFWSGRTGLSWGLILILSFVATCFYPVPVRAESRDAKRATATATLNVLSGTVQHVPAAGGQPAPAANGMNLAIGDRVLTGPKSFALITFLDGTTVTAQPESDIAVKKMDMGKRASKVTVQINTGTVWARVVRLMDPESGLSFESNTATATVHDGLIGGQQNADGSFACWTRTQGMTVVDKHGRTIVLIPGEKVLVKEGEELVPQPFLVNQSTLRVTAPAGFLPLVQMPDQARVAGFVVESLDVNQVFGSLTHAAIDRTHVVEVPAGTSGPYVLLLEAQQDGPVIVKVVGSFKGSPAYQLDLSVIMKQGERVRTDITQQLDPAGETDPKTAKVLSGKATPWRPITGPLPGMVQVNPKDVP